MTGAGDRAGGGGGARTDGAKPLRLDALTDIQRRLIAAVCQAGGGRVGRALRTLLGEEATHIEIFDAGMLDVSDAFALVDGGRQNMVGVFFDLQGDHTGKLGMLLSEHSALLLTDRLIGGQDVLEAGGGLTEQALSALLEVGNIVASAFINSIADSLHRPFLPSPPSLYHDQQDALVDKMGGRSISVLAITFEVQLKERREPLAGQILFAPDENLLGSLLGGSPAAARHSRADSGA